MKVDDPMRPCAPYAPRTLCASKLTWAAYYIMRDGVSFMPEKCFS